MDAANGSNGADGSALIAAERHRISRQLHNSTSQLLVALQLQVEQLKRRVVPGAEQLLDEMDQVLRDIHASIREVVSDQISSGEDTDRSQIELAKRFYSLGAPNQSVRATAIDPGQAVRKLVLQLEAEQDDGKRQMLQSSLIAEEDRFGSACERLDRTGEVVEDLEARIAGQREIAAASAAGGAPQNATRLLANMVDTLKVVTAYRKELMLVRDRNCP